MAIDYQINGESVLVSPNWSIPQKINTRSTLDITVVDLQDLSSIDNGDSIEIINGSTKVFSGIVKSINKSEYAPNYLIYNLNCCDNSALADKRLVADVAENETAADIIINRILPVLAEEGVTQGNIICATVIKKAVFNYVKCSNALDYLKDLTGYNWYIDNDKKLNFFDRGTFTAPFTLSSAKQHYGFQQESSMDEYRNRQYITGGKCTTDTQTKEVAVKNADGKSFSVRYPINQKPTIYVDNVAVSDSNIGVNGFDKNKLWYFNYDSNIITPDSTNNITTQTISVTYVGLINLFIAIDNNDEITDRLGKELGTSGIYETLTKETSLNEKEQAIDFGNGLLLKYGEVKDKISFNTELPGLQAGQLLTVNKPLFSINDTFLIDSINISLIDSNSIEYQIEAIDGISVGGWEEFFRKLIKKQSDFIIADNEILIKIKSVEDKTGYEGELQITKYNCLYPSNTLYPAATLFPGTKNATITLTD